MNYSPSPKSEFLADTKNIESHRVLAQNETLREHLNITLLEYQRRQAAQPSVDLGGCAACHLRQQGAVEFVSLFLNLAETVDVPVRVDTTNLPSNVKPLAQPRR